MKHWDQQIGPSVGVRVRYPEIRLGIELEYERMHDAYPVLNYWHLERDNSLRNNGVEFISNPLAEGDIHEALREAQQNITHYGLEASWRCGGHTHVNVAYWTWQQLFQFSIVYALVEPYLFHEWAPGRWGNHFCVPMSQNNRLVDGMAQDAQLLRAGRGNMLNLLACNKYSALNYKPITQHGTVELRHLPGTTNMDRIQRWCDFLLQLVRVAHEYDSPEQIITEYEDLGVDEMLERVGLHTCDVDPDDVEDGYITACMLVGYEPRKWQDLHWEFPDIPVAAMEEAAQHFEQIDMDRIRAMLEGDE